MSKRVASFMRLFLIAVASLAFASQAAAQAHTEIRLPPHVDPSLPLKDLLPEPPDPRTTPLPWRVADLTQVPEILFQKVRRLDSFPKDFSKLSIKQRMGHFERTQEESDLEVAAILSKVRYLDGKERDQFLRVLLQSRADLAGLPFVLGADARLSKEGGFSFNTEVTSVRSNMNRGGPGGAEFWRGLGTPDSLRDGFGQVNARMAALMQILAVEHKKFGVGLAQYLDQIATAESTHHLTRLALFSFDPDVRYEALKGLRSRSLPEYKDLLLAGFQYPLPEVATFAAEAVAELECKELMPALEKFLDEPDPRAPRTKVLYGREIGVVREVVRLNHHHNCLLCHAIVRGAEPVHQVFTTAPTAPVPSASQPLPAPHVYYESRSFRDPDLRVRADVTYLRQDFSLMQSVSDPGPWPKEQRHDFLVRTRRLSEAEIADYRAWRAEQGPGYVSPHHKAVQSALHALKTPEERIRRLLLNLQK